MPHQRGERPLGFSGRGGRAVLRDSRELPAHSLLSADFQRRRLGGSVLVHLPSPGGQQQSSPSHSGIYTGSHPHSPAWYGDSFTATPSPHRVEGSSHSVTSGDISIEDSILKTKTAAVDVATLPSIDEEMRKRQEIIHEALRRHMDDDNSIGTSEADAASALLFATAAMRRAEGNKLQAVSVSEAECQGTEEAEKCHEDDSSASIPPQGSEERETTKESSGPLKKRRKLMDYLRNKVVATATASKQPLHVSPLPSPQVRSRVASHESSENNGELTPPSGSFGSASTCADSSFDIKEPPCHGGAMNKTAAEISPPPCHVVSEHFPTVLHTILTSSEFGGSVVQWLPDGEAWKILRWDALRRQVLPKYFSQLRDEDGKVGISIDGFLWHLAAWGFEEIQSGPDVGAYKNKFFRKDSIQMCRMMTFAYSRQCDLESPLESKNTPTPSMISGKVLDACQPRSILQVPSLASRSEGDVSLKDVEKTLQWREEQRKSRAIHSPTISYPSMTGRLLRPPETPVFVNYRMADLTYTAEGWQYFPESPLGMRHLGPGLTGYEQRMMQQQRFEFPRSAAFHGTPRVQSGRGALRPHIPGSSGLGNAERGGPQHRLSFPVSNRGKGKLRAAVSSMDVMRPRTDPESSGELEALTGPEKLGEEVAERVAFAISKKTKRKLPLSGSSDSAAAAASASSQTEESKKSIADNA